MASFPFTDSKFHQDSELIPDDGIELDISEGGTIRGRVRGGNRLIRIVLVFDPMSNTDFGTLDDFVINNGIGPHSITYDGVSYTSMYVRVLPRKIKNYADSGYYRVKMELMGDG